MSTVELFAVGDVYLDRSEPSEPWDDLAPELARTDLTLSNDEVPISDGTRLVWDANRAETSVVLR